MIICGAWSLWTGRNARNHGKLNWNAAAAARHISSMLEDFVCSGFEAHHDRAGSTGAVLRDERGVVLAEIARFYSNIADVLMAEALAARDGVILAIEQGAGRVILETDNSTVVTLLRSDDGIRSNIAGIWHEIRELSLSLVSFITCVHVNREGNEAAHLCATMPSLSTPALSWIGAPPNWLWEAASRDCNNSLQ